MTRSTTLWCENPKDPFLTEVVANLVLWKRYLVVERVMMVAAANREKLAEQFTRLLVHAIRYSPARDRFRHKAESPNPVEDDAECRTWVAVHVRKFLAGKIKPLPEHWTKLAEPVEVKSFQKNTTSTGLDVRQIYSALTWAADLEEARNPEERETWIEYHRQTLECALIRIRMEMAESEGSLPDRYERHAPYQDEEDVLDRIGVLVASLRQGEAHRSLWEPIFALGCIGARWIEKFTFDWLLQAAGHSKPALVEQWRAMLAYAEGSPAWKTASRRGREDNRMWDHLLGFSPFSSGFWRSELAPVIEAVREFYERWAIAHASSYHDAEKYIYFLLTEAGQPLRVNGLVILNNAAPTDTPGDWRYSSILSALGTLLDRLLSEQWGEVVANPAAKTAFMKFSTKLVSLQYPLGSELLAAASAKLTKP